MLTRAKQKAANWWMLFSVLFSTLASFLAGPTFAAQPVFAATPQAAPLLPASAPSSVTLVGTFQSELGCQQVNNTLGGDWEPACPQTHMVSQDGMWVFTATIPAGNYEFKVATNDNWSDTFPGNNRTLNLANQTQLKFYYDDNRITGQYLTYRTLPDNDNSRIFTVPGNFNGELGCADDWQPWCLQTFMKDIDGDGIFTFETKAIPPGNYNFKVATNEAWSNPNYGTGGLNGADIPFSIPALGTQVIFRFNTASSIPSVQVGSSGTAGFGHNSQDSLYRQPFGATNPGTPIKLRFRTFANDVEWVRVRFFSTREGGQFFQNMNKVANKVSCYDSVLSADVCDWWETVYTPTVKTSLYYRFSARYNGVTYFYDDDNFKDGGWGETTPTEQDDSYVVTVFDPQFQPVSWLQNAVIYQIFPDRFRNGNPANDPNPAVEPRYRSEPGNVNASDVIITKTWGSLPEGYCQKYNGSGTPACAENPRGRDYYGGDLKGVQDSLDYLKDLGVTVIYFNPIFEAASNHLYDTQDYKKIDHFFGTQTDWNNLVAAANARNMKIVLDGVFNHVSSDSPYFDRYKHFSDVGACESVSSPYRDWFYFRDLAGGPCAGPNGPNTMTYDAWFGFDSLPVLNKNNQQVRDLVYASNNAGNASDSVARSWLRNGATAWRLDVMGDGSFPDEFWQQFRDAVRATDPNSPIIGELWKKEEILPKILGDMADTTMNYRFRNAILGFFGMVDDKGFPDDRAFDQPPSMFAKKIMSTREDYPDATFYTLMNIMDSHDTARLLWWMTTGDINTTRNPATREFNAANVALAKNRMKLAVIAQMTLPGAPTIYYGDEVALNGDDDPDDRRSFPWDTGQSTPVLAATADANMLAHYKALTQLRANHPELRQGQLKFLLTDDTNRTMAYAMRTPTALSIVAINRHETESKQVRIPVANYLRDGVNFTDALDANRVVAPSTGGYIEITLAPLSAAVLTANAGQDIVGPTNSFTLTATPGNGQVGLSWTAPGGDTAKYNVYRTQVSGGGYTRVATQTNTTTFNDTTVVNGIRYYYIVRSVDAEGNEGASSNEVGATPAFPITYAVLQSPKDITTTQGVTPTQLIYGQVYVNGITNQALPNKPELILAQVGFGPVGSDPNTWTGWVNMDFNAGADDGDNYEYQGRLIPRLVGNFDMLVRFSTDGGLTWAYGGKNGMGIANPGKFTVTDNADTTPPAAPLNLRVSDWGASFIELRWDAVPDAAQYAIYRRVFTPTDTYAAPIATVDAPTTIFTDTTVALGKTYAYVVRAIDPAFNESANSNEVTKTAEPKIVQVTFRVRVPVETPPDDKVYIAGDHPLFGPWNPGKQVLTKTADPRVWEVTVPIQDGLTIPYKYTRGAWEMVENWGVLRGTENRSVTINYGTTGTQLVDNTAEGWSGDNEPDRTKAVQFWRDPLVSATLPANGATVTNPSQVLTVTFSRDILAPADGNITGTVAVKAANGQNISGTVALVTSADSVVFTPSAGWTNGVYTATVSGIRSDLADSVAMQKPYVFTFTVNIPVCTGYVVSIGDDNGACGTLSNALQRAQSAGTPVTITFSTNVVTLTAGLSISGNVTLSGDGQAWANSCSGAPGVTITANGANVPPIQVSNGAKLRSLHIKNFGGIELKLLGGAGPNQAKCLKVSQQ